MKTISVSEEIMNLSGKIFVYPMHYLRAGLGVGSIPEPLKTVEEVREKMDTYPENVDILDEVSKDITFLSLVESVIKGEETVEELYERSNKINPANIEARIEKLLYMRKKERDKRREKAFPKLKTNLENLCNALKNI